MLLPAGAVTPARAAGSPAAAPCTGAASVACSHRPAAATATVHPGALAGGWTQLSITGPSARTQPAIAYDPTIHAIVLFGGYDSNVYADNDTWTFANNSWTDITANLTTSPPARWGASMVWDAADGYLVLFGGRTLSGYFNDTWMFNGTGWANVTHGVAPPARSLFEMAYDAFDREVIVDGGAMYDFSAYAWENIDNTWAFAAGNWTNISYAAPGGALDRAGGQAVYDPWNRSVVFVGGGATTNWTYGCTPIDSVQTYVNGSWYEYPSSVGPQQISQEMLTYDSQGPYDFLFGGFAPVAGTNGSSCQQLNTTWVRSDGIWVNITSQLASAPSIRYLSGIAYDPDLQEVLLFGGNGQGAYLGDTWVFVVPSLSVALQPSRLDGAAPLTVQLDANASGGAEVFGYNWSFGDGNHSGAGPIVSHTFTTPDVYNVSVNVTDANNRSSVSNVTIRVVAPLSISVQSSTTIGSAPLAVVFNGTHAGGQAPYRFNWSFGDGAHASVENTTHTYLTSGNFTATLTVSDYFGDVNRSSVDIAVSPQLLAAAAASTEEGVIPLWVNFTSTARGGNGADTYLWTFGDGGTSTLADPAHEFLGAGNYTVNLTVTDTLGRTAKAAVRVVALAPVAASVEAAHLIGVAPYSLTLIAAATGGAAPYTYSWNFGDRSPVGIGVSVGHTYTNPGTYNVVVFVNDSRGDSTRGTATVDVVAAIAAKLVASAVTGEAPDPVTLSFATFSGGEAPFTYAWTFGDGATQSGGAEANHTYERSGAYLAKVVVGDALGEILSPTISLTIVPTVSVTLFSGFGAITLGPTANLTVRASGGPGPSTYAWSGLPASCPSENASSLSCTPTTAQNFSVTVTITDGFGRSASVNGSLDVQPVVVPPPAGGGGSFPILYLAIAFVIGAVAVALLAYWAGRRRSASALGPSSGPDAPPETFPAESVDEAPADGGPPQGGVA